jgi:peptidyl-prolyl cis-trans isomerase A (cyclophilin A)
MKFPHDKRRARSADFSIEPLEFRMLLSATVIAQIPAQAIVSGQTPAPVTLSTYFNDPIVTGTAVVLQTTDGNIPLVLTDTATPQTVANFLQYINSGEYANTIFHRAVPGFILQGGGYMTNGSHIPTFGTIPGETATETLKNTTGSIAMALSNGPNSATSEWFINLTNNPDLDEANTTAADYDGGPFTAFGTVVYNGMTVVNTIANLPEVNDSVASGAWDTLPVLPGYTGSATPATPVPASDLVTINPVILPGGLTYSVTSSNSNLVSGAISNGSLQLTPGAGSGMANITVTATDMGGGTATSTFAVSVVNNSPNVPLGAGGAKSLTYKDADGTVGVVTLKGAGSAVVSFDGSGFSQISTPKGVTMDGTGLGISYISTSSTTAGSTLTITTSGGTKAIDVGGITTDALKSITGKGVTLTGSLISSATIGTLDLAGATGGTITATSLGTVAVSGAFSDNLSLGGAGLDLSKFTAGSITGGTWTIGGSGGAISGGSTNGWSTTFAGAVKTLTIAGNANGVITAGSIATFTVKGALNNSQVHLTGSGNDLNKLAITGALSGSVINSIGGIGAITAAAFTNGEVYAGVGSLSDGLALPSVAADFAATASIGSIKLKSSFSNSDIAAANIGVLTLGTLQTAGNADPTGVVSQTIKSLTATANKKFTLKNLNNASNVAMLLSSMGVTLGEVVITAV